MALLIKVDGTRQEVKGSKPNGGLTWDEIRALIGAQMLQPVACNSKMTGGYTLFYCDEDGKLHGKPVNHAATELSTLTMIGDYLVGDVLFCKRGDK